MTIEYDFGDIDTANKALAELGFSIDGPFVQNRYFVIPRKMPDNYPTMINSKKPRAVALVNIHGKLTIDDIFDKNKVLIECQERLKEGLTTKVKK